MRRWSAMAVVGLAVLTHFASLGAADDASPDAERKIRNEPKYVSTPRYALIVLGAKAKTKVWMVEDGRTLYVDKNANGDLTDEGGPISPADERNLGALDGKPRWDFDYHLDTITPADGSRHANLQLRRWNYNDEQDRYGLSLDVDGQTPMYAGWFGTFWADSPEKVTPLLFGAPLKPRMLRTKEYAAGAVSGRFSLAFVNNDNGEGATTRLSIDAIPKDIVPVVQIEWPVADGAPPLKTLHRLTERCCYWEFYDKAFQPPAGVAPGTATVTVSFPLGTFPLELATDQVQFSVRSQNVTPTVK